MQSGGIVYRLTHNPNLVFTLVSMIFYMEYRLTFRMLGLPALCQKVLSEVRPILVHKCILVSPSGPNNVFQFWYAR